LTVFTKGHSNQTYDNKDNSQITSWFCLFVVFVIPISQHMLQ
jgi:hypothetical protein